MFAILLLLSACAPGKPEITSITPKIGILGEVVTLRGKNFGKIQNESYVSIAGIIPTGTSYISWNDDLISVRTSETGESGLVYVHVKGKRSNGVLFTNTAAVPRPIEGEELSLEPRITSVTPRVGAVGTLITITGNNFGISRENAGVFFSWESEFPSVNPFVQREPEFIEVSEMEFGYESWNSREIIIRLPDGAVSGNFEIRTPRGRSRPVFFEVSGKPGIKSFKEKRNYTINYSVDIKVLEASRPNTLYLWMPQPVMSPSQRNVTLVSRNLEPLLENHMGIKLFKLENLITGSGLNVNLSYHVEVYTQETTLRPLVNTSGTSELSEYTQSSILIPSNDPTIKTLVNTIIGRERNPYIKARLIYDWIAWEMNFTPQEMFVDKITASSIIAAAEKKQSDANTAALLFTTLARAGGIPCIPVAGVLVNSNGQTLRHYWAEFWIEDFGWVPVDPIMGARAVPEQFVLKQDSINYFFGNLDSQRIAFSRGEPVLSQIDSRGRIVSRTQYSLQNIWEEAVGGLESYSSLWSDVVITGIYAE